MDEHLLQRDGHKERIANSSITVDNPNYSHPNLVRLPRYQYFPPLNLNTEALEYCCDEYSQTPLQTIMKAIIIHIHWQITELAWPCVELFEEVHKKFHDSVDAVITMLQQKNWSECFNVIVLTMSDEPVIDYVVMNGINAERMSYPMINGEFKIDVEHIRKVLKLPIALENSQYRVWQPVTKYFLDFVLINTGRNSSETMKLEQVEGRDDIFQLMTTKEENKAFLPLMYCLGMLTGCPYVGAISSTIWIMNKETLFVVAAAFGLLEVDMAAIIFQVLEEDIRRFEERKTLFCWPIWRVLFVVESPLKKELCVRHVPQVNSTFVDISRYAEILTRTVGIEMQKDEDINTHYDRILNTYYCKATEPPTVAEISAVLMFEKDRPIVGHFKPRLLQVNKQGGWHIEISE